MSTIDDERAEPIGIRIERLEAKVDLLLAKMTSAEQTFAGFLSGPLVTRMFRAVRNGRE